MKLAKAKCFQFFIENYNLSHQEESWKMNETKDSVGTVASQYTESNENRNESWTAIVKGIREIFTWMNEVKRTGTDRFSDLSAKLSAISWNDRDWQA